MKERSTDTFRKIRQSPLLAQYTAAFEAATGLPLELHEPELERICHGSTSSNQFCSRLNQDGNFSECVAVIEEFRRSADSVPQSLCCFAGLQESIVPVFAGQTVVAYLSTGQVFVKERCEVQWEDVANHLIEQGCDCEEVTVLEKSWRKSRILSEKSYGGAVNLLAVFATQLSALVEQIVLGENQSEPPAITRAKRYINAHLSENIGLNEVAAHVAMSPYHFCRIFKNVTGLTYKQFLTRRRIELAKCRLRHPDARASEVAYEVGFGSLSQFNRSFRQTVGISPSEWRIKDSPRMEEDS